MRGPMIALALAAATAMPLAAAEGPTLTMARQLQLATSHLSTTAAEPETAVPVESQRTFRRLAASAASFRWQLEGAPSGHELVGAWSLLQRDFLAARDRLPADAPKVVKTELRRVHSLMNRLDRQFGGTGFWSGRRGWSG